MIGGAVVDGNTPISIHGCVLTVRELGMAFSAANNFNALFTAASSSSRGRRRLSADDLKRTAVAERVATAASVVFAVFSSFPTPEQLSKITQRLLHFRSLAGLPCESADAPQSVSMERFLYAMLQLDIPERQWHVVRDLLDVRIAGAIYGVKQLRRRVHALLPVVPLERGGAFTHTTWLLGLWAEVFKPQLDLCTVNAPNAPASRCLVVKLGGDGTSGFRSNGVSANIESVNMHPVSLLGPYARHDGAAMLAGVCLAPEERAALECLWPPVCAPLGGLSTWNWCDTQWRLLPLHDNTSLAIAVHVAGDGGLLPKIMGISSSVSSRDDDNPAACVLCDASRSECVELRTATLRSTDGQCARAEQAQQRLAEIALLPHKQQPDERKALMAEVKNTTVRVVGLFVSMSASSSFRYYCGRESFIRFVVRFR